MPRNRSRAAPQRIVGLGVGGTSSSRLRSMKPVSISPAGEIRWSSALNRKPALVRTGHTSTPSRHVGEPGDRLRALVAAGDQLGDHRVVIGRDCIALLDPGFDPPSVVAQSKCSSRPDARQEALAPGPRHRAAPRSRGHRSPARPALAAAARRSPPATAIRPDPAPVISSVTGCSTCSRVFISMNQMRSAAAPPASAMNSTVPAPS